MSALTSSPWTALIDAQALNGLIASEAPLVILDARFELTDPAAGRIAYEQAHIPGALHADLDRHLAGPVTAESGRHPLPAPTTLAERFGAWGIASGPPPTQVVIYDAGSGAFAARCWWLLRWLGHETVAVLDGGLSAWQALGLPVVHGSQELPKQAANFVASPRASLHIDTAALGEALEAGDVLLADARAPARYAGRQEPIDPVAGHIPGALNHPFDRSLGADGRFRKAEELRQDIEALLGGRAPTELVAMCGSGVTACHLLLAMAAAELPMGRLYAGSWSEWIRDPSRPIASAAD